MKSIISFGLPFTFFAAVGTGHLVFAGLCVVLCWAAWRWS